MQRPGLPTREEQIVMMREQVVRTKRDILRKRDELQRAEYVYAYAQAFMQRLERWEAYESARTTVIAALAGTASTVTIDMFVLPDVTDTDYDRLMSGVMVRVRSADLSKVRRRMWWLATVRRKLRVPYRVCLDPADYVATGE